jgi:[acyl-carrier-protein] S-malonyltransferase
MRDHVEKAVPDLLGAVVELVRLDPFELVGESTRYAQPAIYCASLAGWAQRDHRSLPSVVAGHSLGELSAMAAAGALDPLDGLWLAVRRGELMAECAEQAPGGMLAAVGCDEAYLAAVLSEFGVVVANENAPTQTVLAGPLDGLGALAAKLRADGHRAITLDVVAGFHTEQMEPAVAPFRAALDEVEFRAPAIPVFSCSDARPFVDPRSELARAIARPVRWRQTMSALARIGVTKYIDFGPGQVLARLVPRNLRDAEVLPRRGAIESGAASVTR